MKQIILFPFLVLFFGFPTLIMKAKPGVKSRCELPVNKEERKENKPVHTESKYEKVFSYDNIFYKI